MKKVYIVAGGTGGHINAALAMAEELEKDFDIHFLSGTRYLDKKLFKGKKVTHLASRPLRTKNPIQLFINIFLNALIFLNILISYISHRPSFVIGAGGYICGPTLLAAKMLWIPIFIIEQNAVAGVTNKILSKISNITFTNFKNTKGIKPGAKVSCVGNPIRASITETSNKVVEKINVLIFGGSLGAEQINEAILFLLESKSLEQFNIKHQVGKGNLKYKVAKSYANYEQFEYIEDMHEVYEWSNIIISRAGASTISELRVVKRPSILIPYPLATDNHQYYNALELKEEDLSYIAVIDHTKRGKSLADDIFSSLKIITENNLYYQREMIAEKAALKIKKEIIKNVWNK